MDRTREIVRTEIGAIMPELNRIKAELAGKRAAIYVGGAFQGVFPDQGPALPGHDRGAGGFSDPATKVITPHCSRCAMTAPLSWTMPTPWSFPSISLRRRPTCSSAGVKERPIAFKMGIGFCDHNHERKIPLAGFDGMLQFAREVHTSVTSPVWQFVPTRKIAS